MMKLIDESKLRSLLIDSELLRRLNIMGVNNWDWYGDALFNNPECEGTLEDWEEHSLPSIVDNYESLEHYIEFNCR